MTLNDQKYETSALCWGEIVCVDSYACECMILGCASANAGSREHLILMDRNHLCVCVYDW